MKDNKHIQSFNEHQENLNISDVSDSKLLFLLGENGKDGFVIFKFKEDNILKEIINKSKITLPPLKGSWGPWFINKKLETDEIERFFRWINQDYTIYYH